MRYLRWVIGIGFLLAVMANVWVFLRFSPDSQETELGSIPEVTGQMLDPGALRATKDFRAWIQSLEPLEAKRLAQTGVLRYQWKDLQRTDPTRAELVGAYADNQAHAALKAYGDQLCAWSPDKRESFMERGTASRPRLSRYQPAVTRELSSDD